MMLVMHASSVAACSGRSNKGAVFKITAVVKLVPFLGLIVLLL